jgi:hypothetical protein
VGIGCVLFLWAIVAAIGLAVAATGAILLGSACLRSRFGVLLGGLLAAGGSVVALGAIAFIASWLFWGMWPHDTTSRDAFEDAFGFPAGAEVTQIRSRTSDSTDSHEQFLRFHGPPRTIAAIVRTRFKRSNVDDCRHALVRREGAPPWWTPSPAPQAECYLADPYDQRLASNRASLLYDPATGQAHFHYHGVD